MARKLTPEQITAGYSIEKVESHEAYARNGNAQNPTKYYTWTVKLRGTIVNYGLPYQRDALQFVADHMADPS